MNPQTKAMTRWVVVLTGLGSLMAALDTLVVATALSTIRRDLGATVEELEWTVNAYNLSFAVLLVTGAALGDRLGRRRLYAAGLAIFAVASAAAALAPGIGTLIAARALQGVGSALIIPLGLALLVAAFPPERRGAAIGLFSAVTGLAVASGPLVGGAIVEGVSWQWIFWINVPLGLAAIPLVMTRMRESRGPATGLDLTGLGLVGTGTLGLVWGVVRGNQAGWGSVEVLSTLVAGALSVAAFVAWERRARDPLLAPALFRARAFAAGNAAVFMLFGALLAAVFFYAQLLEIGLGYGPLEAGLRLTPWTATFLTVAPAAGALADRIGERSLLVVGLTLQAAGMVWLALIAEPGMPYSHVLAPFVLAGTGVSLAIPAAQNASLRDAAPATLGAVTGASSMMRQLGGVCGVAVGVAVFAATGSYASPGAFVDGFTPAILFAAALSAVGALAGAAVPGRVRAGSAATTPAAAGTVEEAA